MAPKDSIPVTVVDSEKDQGGNDGQVARGDPVVRNGAGTSETGSQAQEGLGNSVARTREAQKDGWSAPIKGKASARAKSQGHAPGNDSSQLEQSKNKFQGLEDDDEDGEISIDPDIV